MLRLQCHRLLQNEELDVHNLPGSVVSAIHKLLIGRMYTYMQVF